MRRRASRAYDCAKGQASSNVGEIGADFLPCPGLRQAGCDVEDLRVNHRKGVSFTQSAVLPTQPGMLWNTEDGSPGIQHS